MKEKNNNLSSLEEEYEKFVRHLFVESIASTNKEAYHNALVYIRIELASLTGVSGKKCRNFCP